MMHFLGRDFIDGDELRFAPALEGVLAGVIVGQTKLERAEKEAVKTAFFGRSPAQCLILNQMLKKGLSEILRVMHCVAAAAKVTVNRGPVSPAKIRQRFGCLRRRSVARSENNAPRCLPETLAA